MNAIWTIARRELKALFDHPTGYILLIVFIAANDFLFFRQAYLYDVASLRPMLDILPWLLLFLVPAVTMRALAEDTRTGTIEVVLAQPLTELQLLLGKYVGQVLFIWIGLALTLPIPLTLALGADLQVGVIFAQYVGAAFLTAGLAGVGVWASSLTRNQVTAFIIGLAAMFVLVLVGLDPLIVGLPAVLGTIAARLGVLSHFSDITRGVIDLRDVLYFATLAAIFLSLAYLGIMRRRLAPHGGALRRLRAGTAILVAALVMVDLLGGYIGGRLDLTPGHAYTISKGTKQILKSLPDIVTIKLFATKSLPPQIALLRRDIDDLLSDYRSAGGSKVHVQVEDPSTSKAAETEAQSLGVRPVQFNVVGRSELSVKRGYLGIAVRYQDKSEAIPLIQRTDDLEYRLTSMIKSFTQTHKDTVGLVLGTSQAAGGYSTLRQQLEKSYAVRDISLTSDQQPSAGVRVLVIAGEPDSLPAGALNRLRAYLNRGGSALVMAGGMNVNFRVPYAMARPVLWNPLLAPYGLSIKADIVHDLISNQQVGVPTQYGRLFTPYPLWVRAVSTRAHVINEDVNGIVMPWTSTVDTVAAKPGTVTPLLETTKGAGLQFRQVALDPTQQFPRDSLSTRLLAVLVNPLAKPADSLPKGRLVVAGTGDLAGDRFVQNNPQNLAFVLNAVDWLAQDDALIAIRSKNRQPPQLAFSSATKREAAKYLNMVGIPVLLIFAAAIRMWRRRERTRQTYVPLAATGGQGGAA